MSKACASPTARLIQGSRLFSLPRPLPTSARLETTPNGLQRKSDTATAPYPTHQAIDCPHSSRSIGEWGLKRHLPIRTTTKSTAPIRILAQDTNDHVTDFASAGDHSITLDKFQELGIPVLRRASKHNAFGSKKHLSVYEDAFDTTDRSKGGQRWKSQGPWLLGMAATDLDRFLEELQARRPEWLAYLRDYFALRDFEAAKKEALERIGFFGPVEVQNLAVQRDHIIQIAEDEVRTLEDARKAGDQQESRSAFEARCRQIMDSAQRRLEQCEAELETQARHLDAIEHLRREDARVAIITTQAEKEVRQAAEKMLKMSQSQAASERARIDRDDARAKADAEDVAQLAYREVIRRFGEDPSGVHPAELERYARRLITKATTALAAAETGRAEKLAFWEEQERAKYYAPSDEKLQALQKELRDAHRTEQTRSELTSALVHFLDLPGIAGPDSRKTRLDRAASLSRTTDMQESLINHGLMDEEQNNRVPLSTHPGAGLGYLRSTVLMDNHPIYGPQAQKSAVLSRVVRPRTSVLGTEFHAKIGTAGFVANDPKGSQMNRINSAGDIAVADRMAIAVEPYLAGGNKMYMHAEFAHINEAGQVHLHLQRSEKEAVAVKTGDVKEILDDKRMTLNAPAAAGLPNSLLGLRDPNQPSARYGASLMNYRTAPRSASLQ